MGILSFIGPLFDKVLPKPEELTPLEVAFMDDLLKCDQVLHSVHQLATDALKLAETDSFTSADLGHHYAGVLRDIISTIDSRDRGEQQNDTTS